MSKREDEIVAAAAAIFKEKGYQAATTRDIASAVGIQQATLYYYVSSKEELLYLVVREPIAQLYAEVDASLEGVFAPRYAQRVRQLPDCQPALRQLVSRATNLAAVDA